MTRTGCHCDRRRLEFLSPRWGLLHDSVGLFTLWTVSANKLNPAGARQITPEQMALSRLRAQVARLEMELEITKKGVAYFAQELL